MKLTDFTFLIVAVIISNQVLPGHAGLGIRLVIGNPNKQKSGIHQIPAPIIGPSAPPSENAQVVQDEGASTIEYYSLNNNQQSQGQEPIPLEQLEQLTQPSEAQEKVTHEESAYYPAPVSQPTKLMKMKNNTNSLSEKLELPYAQRSTIGLTFPVFQEVDLHKVQRPASVGTIVTDTFIVKEHKLGRSFPTNDIQRKNSVLNGILENMMQDEKPEPVYPGDSIRQEIPLEGNFNHHGVANITQFLLDLSYKSSESKYFVCLQMQNLDRFGKEDMKINVVMGDKHLTYNEIQKLDSLYALVNRGVYDDPAKNAIMSKDIDNIRDFVYYVKDIHWDLVDSARTKANQVYAAHARDYYSHGWKYDIGEDIFTWPYVNTIAYRTL